MAEIADALATLVGENYVSRFNWHNRSYDVIVQAPQDQRLTPDNLGQYLRQRVVRPAGAAVYGRAYRHAPAAEPAAAIQPAQFRHAFGRAGAGRDDGAGRQLPAETETCRPASPIDWLSNSRQFVTEGNRLTFTFVFALVVIFLVLTAQFESFRDPLVILVTVPLAVCGALIAALSRLHDAQHLHPDRPRDADRPDLEARHSDGVLRQSDPAHRRAGPRGGDPPAAASVRMRPILMTTAAMVAGLIPLVFAAGRGRAEPLRDRHRGRDGHADRHAVHPVRPADDLQPDRRRPSRACAGGQAGRGGDGGRGRMIARSLERLRGIQHLRGVAFDLDLAPDLAMTLPLPSIRKVERSMPIYLRP